MKAARAQCDNWTWNELVIHKRKFYKNDVIEFKGMRFYVERSLKGGVIVKAYITHKRLKRDGHKYIGHSVVQLEETIEEYGNN